MTTKSKSTTEKQIRDIRRKTRLAGDTAREATSDEVKELRAEMSSLKEALAESVLEARVLKKSLIADGGHHE